MGLAKRKKTRKRRVTANEPTLTDGERHFQKACRNRGFWVLFETINGVRTWRVFNKTTGVETLCYWPLSGKYRLQNRDDGYSKDWYAILDLICPDYQHPKEKRRAEKEGLEKPTPDLIAANRHMDAIARTARG